MIRLRKEALSLASQEDWEPVFNLIQEPSDSKWCWLMTNEMGTLRFSLTHDMTVADLHRRFAKMMNHLDHSEGDECEICYKHTKRISCTKCNNMICREYNYPVFCNSGACYSTKGHEVLPTVRGISSNSTCRKISIVCKQQGKET